MEVVESSRRWRWRVVPSSSTLQGEEMLVQTLLSDGSEPSVVFAEPELEVSLVVGRELHLHLEDLALAEVGGHHPQPVLSTQLLRSGLGQVGWISTHPALSLVPVPLSPEPPAVTLVVVDVGGGGEPVPPHGGPAGRLPQPAVRVDGGEVREEENDPHCGGPGPSQ